jgi:hypothetical protein
MPRQALLPISWPRGARPRAAGVVALLLGFLAAACGDPLPILTVTAPIHGTFTTNSSIAVTGSVTAVPVSDLELTVNGVVVPLNPDGSFSTTVAVSQSAVLNPVLLRAKKVSNNYTTIQRVMVIGGPAVADGMFSGNGIGMRINDTGLDQLQPTIQSLINGSFNIQSLILAANPIVSNYCVGTLPFIGCIGHVDANATSVSYTNPIGVDLDAIPGATKVSVAVSNLRVNYHVSGFVSCDANIRDTITTVSGNYDQIPASPDPSNVDVNQQGNVGVNFTSFNNEFTSGICDFPLIGSLIVAIIGDVQPLVQNGLITNLADPDGNGPLDAPIALAIQNTLAGLSIAGPIGASLGVALDAQFNNVAEDTAGLTYRIDSRITQPTLTPGSPDQFYSANPAETFPTFAATTPTTNLPYGLGLALSSGTFNQLLKSEIESGLLQLDLTEFAGLPLTMGLVAGFVPDLASLDPYMPAIIRVRPTLAPFVTGQDGPGGEIGDLRVPAVIGTVIGITGLGQELEMLKVAFDARIGLQFTFDNQTSSLVPTFGTIQPADIQVKVLSYLAGAISPSPGTEASLQNFLPQVLALALPELSTSLGTFPLPSFLGLQFNLVELKKVNNYLTLFVNLTP